MRKLPALELQADQMSQLRLREYARTRITRLYSETVHEEEKADQNTVKGRFHLRLYFVSKMVLYRHAKSKNKHHECIKNHENNPAQNNLPLSFVPVLDKRANDAFYRYQIQGSYV
jgi:hypothetical protein